MSKGINQEKKSLVPMGTNAALTILTNSLNILHGFYGLLLAEIVKYFLELIVANC